MSRPDWPLRWRRKKKRVESLAALGSKGWDHFRRDNVLMEGIQTKMGEFEENYRRCNRYKVPAWLTMDDELVGMPEGKKIDGVFYTPGSLKYGFQVSRILEHWCGGINSLRVLEIGSGYGGMTIALSRAFKISQYVAIDSPSVLAIRKEFLARRLGELRACYAIDIPVGDSCPGEFDLVVSSNALLEMPHEETKAYMKLIERQLVSGGAFYTSNTGSWDVHPRDLPFDDSWSYLLKGNPFGDESYWEVLAVRV